MERPYKILEKESGLTQIHLENAVCRGVSLRDI